MHPISGSTDPYNQTEVIPLLLFSHKETRGPPSLLMGLMRLRFTPRFTAHLILSWEGYNERCHRHPYMLCL